MDDRGDQGDRGDRGDRGDWGDWCNRGNRAVQTCYRAPIGSILKLLLTDPPTHRPD